MTQPEAERPTWLLEPIPDDAWYVSVAVGENADIPEEVREALRNLSRAVGGAVLTDATCRLCSKCAKCSKCTKACVPDWFVAARPELTPGAESTSSDL